jgi:peptidoglycan/xylan/chitin deacetylase (PgdA/CDA1 family)
VLPGCDLLDGVAQQATFGGAGPWLGAVTTVGSGCTVASALDPPPPPVDCSVEACVALTFDDGPSEHTEGLLDTLVALEVPATFFVTGTTVSQRPETVRRLVEAGMEVQNHTEHHADLTALSAWGQQQEVAGADEELVDAGVPVSTMLRPPYGAWDERSTLVGKTLVLWSLDTLDWTGRTAEEIQEVVADGVVAGDIVLLHDTSPASVAAVPGIVADLRAQGLRPVTVGELVPDAAPGDVIHRGPATEPQATR